MDKRGNRNGFFAIAVGTLIAVFSIAVTAWDSFWRTLGIADNQRSVVASALAILFVNLGFLLSVFFQQADLKAELVENQRRELQDLKNSIPSLGVFATYTGERAMALLTTLLPTATVAHNTRILSSKMSETSHAAASPWDLAVRNSVRDGLVFREIVSPDNEQLARGRLAACTGCAGRYQAAVLRHNLPAFMNFIVLEFENDRKEVMFGWVVSMTAGWEGTVVRSSEEKIVALFERWHAELLAAGRYLS